MAKLSDMDLMLYFDGELSPEQEAEVHAALSESDSDSDSVSDSAPVSDSVSDEASADSDQALAKLEAIEQIGETLRTQLELEADDVDHRLGAELWELVERRLEADARADAITVARPSQQAQSAGGLWTELRAWLSGRRSHIMTSVVTAGAVAALIMVFRPPTETIVHTQGPERIVQVPAQSASPIVPVSTEPAAVQELNVSEGTGYILTIPGEGGENDTTVIWIEPEESMEEPI